MRKISLLKTLFISLIIFTIPSALFADAETHDGFYFNFLLGFGYDQTTIESDGSADMDLTGTGYNLKFKMGGTPVENFIIFGTLGFYDLEGPEISSGSYSETVDETYVTYSEFGGGFCYYIMPVNVFISADLSAVQGVVGNTEADTSESSDTGWSLSLSVGKEWWISDNWGIGAAVVATYGVMPNEVTYGEDETLIHKYMGIAITATYN
jgi:hypothetical protein